VTYERFELVMGVIMALIIVFCGVSPCNIVARLLPACLLVSFYKTTRYHVSWYCNLYLVLVNFRAPSRYFVEEVFDESNKKFRILQYKHKPYLFRSQSLVLSCMEWRINEWYSNRRLCFSRVGRVLFQ